MHLKSSSVALPGIFFRFAYLHLRQDALKHRLQREFRLAQVILLVVGVLGGGAGSVEVFVRENFPRVLRYAYGWIGQQSGSGFCDRLPATLGVFASLDRL
jgi:hypothetical protein